MTILKQQLGNLSSIPIQVHIGKKMNYALIPTKKKTENFKGYSDLLEKVPSHGTDFYRFLVTIRVPFEEIEESQLLPKHTINLNASPAGSESQEYS